MSFENYVVCAKFFVPSKNWDKESLIRLNRRIDDVMENRGYRLESGDPRDLLLGNVSFMMKFGSKVSVGKRSVLNRLLKSDARAYHEAYMRDLRTTVDDHPKDLRFRIDIGTLADSSTGYLIEVESEPTIVAKIRQLGLRDEIDEVHYDNIVYQNKRAVGEIIQALGARVIEDPKVLRPREKSVPAPMIETAFIDSTPSEVAACLREANRCFACQSFLASALMIRKAIEVAATKKLHQGGRDKELFDRDGYEVGLGKKLDLLPEVASGIGKTLDQVKLVKWLGDTSAHDSRTEVRPSDLQSMMPLLRSFLTKLELKQ